MHYLADYAFFFAKFLTVVILILAAIAGLLAIVGKGKEQQKSGKLVIKKLNDSYQQTQDSLHEATLSKAELKRLYKTQKQKLRKHNKQQSNSRLFVIDFEGDIKASAVNSLSELVTAILLVAKANDEVLVRLESGGGLVNAYGLAASQLQRLRDAKIKLTVAVDKIAASGGYMMACIADQLIASPFAIIGSIGVIAQLPNFNRLLNKQQIDFEQITAGEYKRTLTMFGENTEKGREKLQEEINDTHELFKEFIQLQRPQLDLTKVATGEHWFGIRALGLQLIDKLQTSNDYLLLAKDQKQIYELQYKSKQPFTKRLGLAMELVISKFLTTQVKA